MASLATALTNSILLAASALSYRLWRNPRGFDKEKRVKYGVGPNGASDLIGYKIITITPQHVGKKIAVFTAYEIKTERDTEKKNQQDFINRVILDGGIGGFLRSTADIVDKF